MKTGKVGQARNISESVATLTRQMSWTVRELRRQVERKAFARNEAATLQAPALLRAESVDALGTSHAQVFKAPYFLDFLGLCQRHGEAGLEGTIRLMTMKVSQGLGFPVVARLSIKDMPAPGADRGFGCRLQI